MTRVIALGCDLRIHEFTNSQWHSENNPIEVLILGHSRHERKKWICQEGRDPNFEDDGYGKSYQLNKLTGGIDIKKKQNE